MPSGAESMSPSSVLSTVRSSKLSGEGHQKKNRSPNAWDDLSGEGVGAEGSDDSEHCESSVELFCAFIMVHGVVVVGVDVNRGFFGEQIVLSLLVLGDCHFHSSAGCAPLWVFLTKVND